MADLPLAGLAQSITLLWGWPRALLAAFAGALGALALPPFGFFPVLFISFPVLILLLDGTAAGGGRWATLFSAARTGWWFGFGYFLAGLWWIGSAFLVEAERFAMLLPLAVLVLPAGLALFTALGAMLARYLWCTGAWRILSLAIGMMVAEYARAHVLSGFPWNLFGHALTQNIWLAQSASLVGVLGLTFVALVLFSTPVVLVDETAGWRDRAVLPLAAIMALFTLAVFGAVRLSQNDTTFVDNVRLRLMQADIPQDARFEPASKPWIMRRYLELSDKATSEEATGLKDVTHLLWPESSFPFFLIYDREALADIARLLPETTTLITGAVRPEPPSPGSRKLRIFNSVYAINGRGEITATYDKVHLVPFGEFLPLQDLLERIGLEQLTRVRGGFERGPRFEVMRVAGLPPFAPLICYEIIFPRLLSGLDERPQWILNVTNDAWFGFTPGPYQHAHHAVVRAIEEGLPVVRPANNGISVVVDPFGRIIRSLPLGARDVLDARLPRSTVVTPYARYGDITLFLIIIFCSKVVFSRRLRFPN